MTHAVNLSKTRVCCVGNHDFDFGVDTMIQLIKKTPDTTWLLSNVLNSETKQSLDPVIKEKVIVDWDGVKVGFMGIVEEEWIATLNVDTSQILYKDFVEEGIRLAKELRDEGAELIVAVTHMRLPNDQLFAQSVEGVDLILGGHDHFYHVETLNGKLIVKSDCDFKCFTEIVVTFSEGKPTFEHKKVEITSETPEDEEMKAIVDDYKKNFEKKALKPLFYSTEDLDARSSTLRTQESNIGNFICDVLRIMTEADCSFLNGGTLRTDDIIPKGVFSLKDLIRLIPFQDVIIVLKVKGSSLLKAIENGVSMYPKHEGRFPQVSGIRFSFDPAKDPGSRVVEAYVGKELLDKEKYYKLATKSYIGLSGKDGYDCFQEDCEVLVDTENGFELATMVRNYLIQLKVTKNWKYRSRGTTLTASAIINIMKGATVPNSVTVSPIVEGRINIV